MSKFKVGQNVRVLRTDRLDSFEEKKVVGKVFTIVEDDIRNEWYVLKTEIPGLTFFFEEELEAVDEIDPDIKVDAFRKATELLPDGLVDDRIQLAEWLIKDG